MAKFDVTKIVMTKPINIMDRRAEPGLYDLLHWLDENIGKYRGSDTENKIYCRYGDGWCITKLWNGSPSRPESWQVCIVSHEIDIIDEDKATLFALKWI
jgi:hypothetical protein